ncbi:putative methyltransferase DDB_G0268948 [Hyperolius riggenbachi]|uniref:putative methyltransferase DDB_G0268948 n=1 Tax=Hyperolius riggenbachi TaxID=752182 RepID=UPI0035A2863C
MATQLFEGKEHASYYQKYRFSPPQEIKDLIFSFVDERIKKPHGFAVDVGCGTGQSTIILAPFFEKVLGTDISAAQIEEAKKAHGLPNVTFSACPAEEVPVGDASVDLLTACAAVHWFNIPKFLKEVDRVLKPRGCLAFYSYRPHMEVHYKDCSEEMSKVFREVEKILAPYQHEKVHHVKTGYEEIFEAIPYTDKKRLEKVVTKIPMSLAAVMGLIQTFSMYQLFLGAEPEKAQKMVQTTQEKFLQIMGVTSTDTEVEVWMFNVLVLAAKPQ